MKKRSAAKQILFTKQIGDIMSECCFHICLNVKLCTYVHIYLKKLVTERLIDIFFKPNLLKLVILWTGLWF